jgi:hypothetical protein
MTDAPGLSKAKSDAIEQLFKDMPEGFGDWYNAFEDLNLAFRTKLAEHLEPRLNAHFMALHPETYNARREVAGFVDGMLSNFGVCATHENAPAMIIAESAHPRRANSGHFVLLVPSSHDRFARKSPSDSFPKLHLMAAPHCIGDLMRAAYDFSIELAKGAKGRGR